MNEAQLQYLLDKDQIAQTIMDYGLSFDRRDWSLQRSLFTERIEMDFSASIGSGLAEMDADAWVAGVQAFFERLPATQHIAFLQNVRIEGNEAFAISLLHAQHYLPNGKGGPVQKMVGWYENWLVRSGEGWKIRKMVQHIDWNEGNWWIFEKAAGLAQ